MSLEVVSNFKLYPINNINRSLLCSTLGWLVSPPGVYVFEFRVLNLLSRHPVDCLYTLVLILFFTTLVVYFQQRADIFFCAGFWLIFCTMSEVPGFHLPGNPVTYMYMFISCLCLL